MNKKINKIIISVVCVILAIVGFSIYSMNTKNTSTEVKTEEKQEEPVVAKGDEPKTDQDTELTDQDKEGMSAVNVFMQGFQEVFNVEDAQSVDVNSFDFLGEEGKKQLKELYETDKKYNVTDLQIIKVVNNHEKTKDKNGYLVYYKNAIKVDGKDDIIENKDGIGFATAWIYKDSDNKYKIDLFCSDKFTTLE